jgi:putative lipoic acid-binding regulatory protein
MSEDPFLKLREQLELLEWPSVFLFKFIIPADPETIALASAIFDETADVAMHPSKNGNYVSLSVKEMMLDVDSIIETYRRAVQIKGLIAL